MTFEPTPKKAVGRSARKPGSTRARCLFKLGRAGVAPESQLELSNDKNLFASHLTIETEIGLHYSGIRGASGPFFRFVREEIDCGRFSNRLLTSNIELRLLDAKRQKDGDACLYDVKSGFANGH